MDSPTEGSGPPRTGVAVLGGGCFWCTEAAFDRLDGVVSVESGYAGGEAEDPTYEQVCTGRTGHAEVARVVFDPDRTSYADLLRVFFAIHDPTTRDRQGADVGTQYRSIILTTTAEQKRTAEEVIDEVQGDYTSPIVTEVEPLEKFWPAENYHQEYYDRNPNAGYCQAVIRPKLKKLEMKFADRLKEQPEGE